MLALLPLVMELLGLVPAAIKLGTDITDSVTEAIRLYNLPAPATPAELASLQTMIDLEKQKMADMTAELDKDPPP